MTERQLAPIASEYIPGLPQESVQEDKDHNMKQIVFEKEGKR